MYWLLDYDLQEKIRVQIMRLQSELNNAPKRGQKDQTFPFVGRKNRNIAKIIIQHLLTEDGVVCDPFCGSGTFAYAALDCDKKVIANEWELYANRMSTAPFRGVPSQNELNLGLEQLKKAVLPTISKYTELNVRIVGMKLCLMDCFLIGFQRNSIILLNMNV